MWSRVHGPASQYFWLILNTWLLTLLVSSLFNLVSVPLLCIFMIRVWLFVYFFVHLHLQNAAVKFTSVLCIFILFKYRTIKSVHSFYYTHLIQRTAAPFLALCHKAAGGVVRTGLFRVTLYYNFLYSKNKQQIIILNHCACFFFNISFAQTYWFLILCDTSFSLFGTK